MKSRPSDHSRETFRLIVENVDEFAVFATDLEGRILSWNPGVGRLLCYEEGKWVGQHASIIFTDEPGKTEQAVCWEEMRRALATGRSEDRRWHRRKDGSRFWANGYLILLRGEEGEPAGFTKILRDETSHKRAEEEVRRARDEMEHRVEERTTDLREMSGLLLEEVKERTFAQG